MGCNGPDLLIAGEQQKRRRAAIALDASREEVRFGMPKLTPTMRWHRSARMLIGIDQGAERARALDDGIEIELQLACEGEIRALAGRRDDAVERPKGAGA